MPLTADDCATAVSCAPGPATTASTTSPSTARHHCRPPSLVTSTTWPPPGPPQAKNVRLFATPTWSTTSGACAAFTCSGGPSIRQTPPPLLVAAGYCACVVLASANPCCPSAKARTPRRREATTVPGRSDPGGELICVAAITCGDAAAVPPAEDAWETTEDIPTTAPPSISASGARAAVPASVA